MLFEIGFAGAACLFGLLGKYYLFDDSDVVQENFIKKPEFTDLQQLILSSIEDYPDDWSMQTHRNIRTGSLYSSQDRYTIQNKKLGIRLAITQYFRTPIDGGRTHIKNTVIYYIDGQSSYTELKEVEVFAKAVITKLQ